jgi:putative isomerase
MRNRFNRTLLAAVAALTVASCQGGATKARSDWKLNADYVALHTKLAKGWNTWDVGDVLSQVYLPQGFAITLRLTDGKETVAGPHLGAGETPGLVITPGGHAWDGSYTDLTVRWKDRNVRVQTAADGDDLVVMATPGQGGDTLKLILVPEMKWGRSGKISTDGSARRAEADGKSWRVFVSGKAEPVSGNDAIARWEIPLNERIAISVNRPVDLAEIETRISEAGKTLAAQKAAYGDNRDLYDAYQSVFAWNMIYDPLNDRVITPVSRAWCYGQGFVLFEWDTYFGAYQLSLDNRDLAYANLIAITKEVTPDGFVPNFTTAKHKSADRSQPPVGSMVLDSIYRKYHDKWIVELLFDDLLSWNRWWPRNRDSGGYLCWGTDPIPITPQAGKLEQKAVNQLQGAKYESGLDNSPMYDGASFDPEKHLMMLADVGLISLYVMDCNALADLAEVMDRPDVRNELHERARTYGQTLETLWDEETGLYLNKDLATGELSHRLSPTLFYPLLTRVPDRRKAGRMIAEHLVNPAEFWGDWVLPSIARDDPAYSNEYWRGRIWGPMNFLVYLGLRNYDLAKERAALVERSRRLLLHSFGVDRTVHENYDPDTGEGTSDDYYHWGALLGFMTFLEENRE